MFRPLTRIIVHLGLLSTISHISIPQTSILSFNGCIHGKSYITAPPLFFYSTGYFLSSDTIGPISPPSGIFNRHIVKFLLSLQYLPFISQFKTDLIVESFTCHLEFRHNISCKTRRYFPHWLCSWIYFKDDHVISIAKWQNWNHHFCTKLVWLGNLHKSPNTSDQTKPFSFHKYHLWFTSEFRNHSWIRH